MSAGDNTAQGLAEDLHALTQRVVTIWRELIPGPVITAGTNLFDLGASSLIAVRMKALIRTELGREIEVEDVLDHPTPGELAAVIATAEPWSGAQA